MQNATAMTNMSLFKPNLTVTDFLEAFFKLGLKLAT